MHHAAAEISSQPVCLHTRQPAPPHSTQLMSTSADGSVNGKYDGRSRIVQVALEERFAGSRAASPSCCAKLTSVVDDEAFDLVEHRRVRDVGSLR